MTEGIGLHSGQPVQVDVKLAPEGAGLTFIHNGINIPAIIDCLKDTDRGTTLNGVAVVEHFLSAAYGIGAYDLTVEVSGDELPALDGSALPWVKILAGLRSSRPPSPIIIKQPIKLIDGSASIEVLPADGFEVSFMISFEGIGEQSFVFDAKDSYVTQIAPARTFGYLEEYETLKSRGLALGASAENVLILDKKGYVGQPRFPDEPVRHKVLDLLGDLALLGRPLQAKIIARRSGHRLNAELVRRIFSLSASHPISSIP